MNEIPSDSQADASVAEPDAEPSLDAALALSRHLLLSEVKTAISTEEFIELYNPTEAAISLETYYLADNAGYALLPGAFGQGPRPEVHNSDFLVRFPPGSVIEPGQVVVVALSAPAFAAHFLVTADYAIRDAQGSVAMLPAFSGAVGAQAGLTDSGEGIVLCRWDGLSDLVTDVDMVTAGAATTQTNRLPDKSDLTVDGPDDNPSASKYVRDQSVMDQMPLQADVLQSYQRIAPESGQELQEGDGNGEHGHDETSERIFETWALSASPSPGTVPAALAE